MSRINDLDKVLNYVRLFSKDLAPIEDSELAMNINMEIDLLVEYLEELRNRGFITCNNHGSYITLRGRMALENAKNGKPFYAEYENDRIKKIWSVVKIIAAVLNATAIIVVAVWAQLSSNEKSELERENNYLKEKILNEQVNYANHLDSLKTIIEDSNITKTKHKVEKIE